MGRKRNIDGLRGGVKGCILCGNAGASGQSVEGNSLAEEDLADGAADCGAVVDG